MAPENPARTSSDDEGLDRLHDLAELLASQIAEQAPDWCAMAASARELAAGTEARCEAPPATSAGGG